jgi:uncharacterized protein (TIGR04255 family)
MNIGEKIKPIKEKNSIREAVISVLLANQILKPEKYKALIETDLKDTFQLFEPLSQVKLQFKNVEGKIGQPDPQITDNAGFKFSSFKNGNLVKALQGLNEVGRTFISFHCLDYNSWDEFYKEYNSIINVIAKQQTEIFINACSLHYIDEFLWIDEKSKLDVNLFLKNKNEYLPETFYNSANTAYTLVTEKVNGNIKYIDRIEVVVNSGIRPNLIISHNVTQPLKNIVELKELINDSTFNEIFSNAHIHNKEILGNLLTDEVQVLIGLK